VCHIDWLL